MQDPPFKLFIGMSIFLDFQFKVISGTQRSCKDYFSSSCRRLPHTHIVTIRSRKKWFNLLTSSLWMTQTCHVPTDNWECKWQNKIDIHLFYHASTGICKYARQNQIWQTSKQFTYDQLVKLSVTPKPTTIDFAIFFSGIRWSAMWTL